ncbi:amino acid permease [Swingsia samuiensis]|uniref:Amino acid permease n=1 Tax=Swingsia samuiensis TaxID=1293412 RepID=A0A4Y6UL32_9PROT|nr:amino acid permease [Swingsia samuiensis]QDH16745.1 amino acid permease [Swingsia samuiensis]
MISVGGIMGAGLFVGTSATISSAGPAVLLAYILAGLFVWAVMLVMGKLASQSRRKGSFITWVEESLGRQAAFVTGWSYAFLWVVTAGAQAIAGGLLLKAIMGLPVSIGAVGFIILGLVLNIMPVKAYGSAEAFLSILKLLALALFACVGFEWLFTTSGSLQLVDQHLFHDGGGFSPMGVWGVLTVVPMIVQTFSGCEIAVVAASDSMNPLENIKRAVKRLPFLILLFYFGSVLVILSVVSWTSIISGQSPFLYVMQKIGIPIAEYIAMGVTLLAVISCLNSAKYVVSRVVNELSGIGCAPTRLQKSSEGSVPVYAVILTSVAELLIVGSALYSPSHIYSVLLEASGGVIMIVYFLVCFAFIKVHRKEALTPHYLLALISSALVVVFFLIMLANHAARYDALLALGSTLAFGVLGMLFVKKRLA